MNAPDYRREGATVNLTLTINQLDAANAQSLKQHLRRIPLVGIERVAIDLGTVTFIDSSGVGALLTLCKWLPPGAVVQLNRVHAEVHRVFEITA
jgi:anti-sigma B factor antagonist